MIEYYWRIIDMKRKYSDGAVVFVNYRLVAAKDGIVKTLDDSIEFTPNPLSESFIQFNNLTVDNVVDWIQSSLGETKIQELKNKLNEEIDNHVTYVTGLPWSNT